ncbi:hypothetical protein H5410_065095 [Solanum commersonii]|uniref:Uncharacterized protein n=1 Tax=Solanum commersonii TaxID=4109 RepID=A0A9J5VXH2_SOLCO|nr:hypothetical protein H5410_065095 [Solanum commersonii]
MLGQRNEVGSWNFLKWFRLRKPNLLMAYLLYLRKSKKTLRNPHELFPIVNLLMESLWGLYARRHKFVQ